MLFLSFHRFREHHDDHVETRSTIIPFAAKRYAEWHQPFNRDSLVDADGIHQCRIDGGTSPSFLGSRRANRPSTSVK